MGSQYNRRAKSTKVDFAFKQGALLDTMFQQMQFGNSPTDEQKAALDEQLKTVLTKDPAFLADIASLRYSCIAGVALFLSILRRSA